MTILVTGANGQLGNGMRLVAKNSRDKYIFTDVCDAHPESVEILHKLAGEDIVAQTLKLDITDLSAVRSLVAENHVQAIVNCAAYTNVDAAKEHRELAERLNAKAAENLAVAMKEADGLLVHVSTDYVFGGDPYNTPCREDQQGTPTGVYGLTKLHGEQAIQRVGCKHLIIRTAWLYSEFGKNFCKTMLHLTATQPRLKVVFDQVGTPTYASDLAEVIYAILERRAYKGRDGIYHFSDEGVCSWYDFTKMIAEYAGNHACDVQPCHSDEFPSKVERPSYSVLDKTKIKETFGVTVPYWTESLRKCINNLK